MEKWTLRWVVREGVPKKVMDQEVGDPSRKKRREGRREERVR